MALRIKNTYTALQKRGKYSGFPTTFVEFAKKTDKSIKGKAIATIIGDIKKMKNAHVCLTGIRPLEQDEAISLVYELVAAGRIDVVIESDCSVELQDVRSMRSFSYAVNVNCPSSDREDLNHLPNLIKLSARDEIRFRIKYVGDYEFAKQLLKKFQPKAETIFVDETENGELADWLIEDKLHRVRYESNLPQYA